MDHTKLTITGIKTPTPEILWPKSFRYEDVRLVVSDTWHTSSNSQINAQIQLAWEQEYNQALEAGKKVWDGDTYRLQKLEVKNGQVFLYVNFVKYSFVHGYKTIRKTMQIPEADWPQHISVGALLKTQDGKYIFGERSGHTMSRHAVDIIGGGWSKNEMVISTGDDIRTFLHREIKEETNVDASHVVKDQPIGILRSHTSNVIVISFVELDLRSNEVLALFHRENDGEMKNLLFIEEANLRHYLLSLGGYKPVLADIFFGQ